MERFYLLRTKLRTNILLFSFFPYLCSVNHKKNKDMITVSAREFRSNQASIFDKADGGEKIIIRRGKKQAYTLVPVYDEDMDITPQLQAKIDQARQEYKEGRTLRFESAEKVQKWMDEL